MSVGLRAQRETTVAQISAPTPRKVSHLAPRELAEVAWKYGMKNIPSYCGNGTVRIGGSAQTTRIIKTSNSMREFCPECVAIGDRRICEGWDLGGSND